MIEKKCFSVGIERDRRHEIYERTSIELKVYGGLSIFTGHSLITLEVNIFVDFLKQRSNFWIRFILLSDYLDYSDDNKTPLSYSQNDVVDSLTKFLLSLCQNIAKSSSISIDEITFSCDDESDTKDLDSFESKKRGVGEYLCRFLLNQQKFAKSTGLIKNCLICLFGISRDSQTYALDNGFTVYFLEEIKHCLIKLKMTSAVDNESVSRKKKVYTDFESVKSGCMEY